jgi:capsular polysaccharide biosynthesis protein
MPSPLHDVAHASEPPAPRLVPRVTTLTAARRHWFLVALITLLFTGAGVAVALVRQPVYTAETRLVVGRIDVTAPGALGSFTVATQAIASQYSRSIDAEGITRRVAPRAGMSPRAVASRVSATPIPESPVIKVFASGSSAAGAVRLANLASSALVTFTTQLNRSNPDTSRLLTRFTAASRDVVAQRSELRRLRRSYVAKPTRAKRDEMQAVEVKLRVAQLQSDTLRQAYDASTQSQAATSLVQILERASSATSDRFKYLQFLGFIGLVAGLAVGLALATLRANRLLRRQLGL